MQQNDFKLTLIIEDVVSTSFKLERVKPTLVATTSHMDISFQPFSFRWEAHAMPTLNDI